MKLELPGDSFAHDVAQGLAIPGARPAQIISRAVAHHIEESVKAHLGPLLLKPPRVKTAGVGPDDSVETLAALAEKGCTVWYPEITFSTPLSDQEIKFNIQPAGFTLASFYSYDASLGQFNVKRSQLKKQSNYRIKLSAIKIGHHVFRNARQILAKMNLPDPYRANPAPQFDGGPLFHKVVAFDHVLDGTRVFCACSAPADVTP